MHPFPVGLSWCRGDRDLFWEGLGRFFKIGLPGRRVAPPDLARKGICG